MSDDPKDDPRINEYEHAFDGYQSRDEIIPREFASMLQAFFVFFGLIAAAKAFATLHPAFAKFCVITIGFGGFVGLLAFLVDIQANTSCKRALRDRAIDIERELGPNVGTYWKTINGRKQHTIERFMKGTIKKFLDFFREKPSEGEGSTGSVFVVAAEILVVLWLVFAIVIYFAGADSITVR